MTGRIVARDYLLAVAEIDPSVCDVLSEGELLRVAVAVGETDSDPGEVCLDAVPEAKLFESGSVKDAAERAANAELSIEGDIAAMNVGQVFGTSSTNGGVMRFVHEGESWKVDSLP